MTSQLSDFIESGKALDADEREIAVLAIQEVADSERAEIDAAWEQVVNERLDEVVSGAVTPVSGKETIAIARSRSASSDA